MSSMSGYITYIQYTAGTNKGQTAQGDVFNNPFHLGTYDKEGNPKDLDRNYTGAVVVENVEAGEFKPAWGPVFQGKVEFSDDNGVTWTEIELDPETGTAEAPADGKIKYVYDNIVIPQNDLPIVNAEMKSIPLVARARRVAIYYSQIAAFQA